MVAHRLLSFAMRSNDDNDWPVTFSMLPLHDLRGLPLPCDTILGGISWQQTWPSHDSLQQHYGDNCWQLPTMRRDVRNLLRMRLNRFDAGGDLTRRETSQRRFAETRLIDMQWMQLHTPRRKHEILATIITKRNAKSARQTIREF